MHPARPRETGFLSAIEESPAVALTSEFKQKKGAHV